MVVAVFSHPLSPIQQRVIVVFTRDTPEPSSPMLGVDQGHVCTTAGAKTRGDPEIHVLGEVEFSPCRPEVFNRDGHVVFVDTPATTSIADVHGCLHVALPPRSMVVSYIRAHVSIVVNWHPNIGAFFVLEFHTVRITLVPAL